VVQERGGDARGRRETRVRLLRELQLDFYGSVRLVNAARTFVEEGVEDLGERIRSTEWREDPKFLRPALADDGLLLALGDILEDEDDDEDLTLKDLSQKLHLGRNAVRQALERDDFSGLPSVAALLPGLEADDDDARTIDNDDNGDNLSSLQALRKRDAAAARHQLIEVARKANAILLTEEQAKKKNAK